MLQVLELMKEVSDDMDCDNSDAEPGYHRYILELSPNLREVSQCQEKTPNPTRALALLKVLTIAFTFKNFGTFNKVKALVSRAVGNCRSFVETKLILLAVTTTAR